MPKFFVKENQISNNKIEIVGDDVNHITNVLRMKQGEILKVCNQETGENYIAEIINAQKNSVTCEIQEKLEETAESNVDITLYQGLPKFEKMELIIQKNTEVGVNAIVPVIMERTVVKLDEKQVSKKLERWQKIAEIAAKQSMRDKIPEIKNK
jgi:16S rRNA (uracil1498-N3)-methyltransferase